MKNERDFFDTKQKDAVSASEYANASTHADGSMKPERDEPVVMASIKANRLMRINSAATDAKRAPKKKFTIKSKSEAAKPAAANKKRDKKRLFKAAEQTQAHKHSNADSSESPLLAKKSSYDANKMQDKKRLFKTAEQTQARKHSNANSSESPVLAKKVSYDANKMQDKKRLFKAAEQTQARKHSNANSSESPVLAKKSSYDANKMQDKKRLFKAAEQTQARKHSNAKSFVSPIFAKKSFYDRGEFSAKRHSMRSKIHNPADSNTPRDGENTSASKLPARSKKPLVICGIIAVAAAFFVFLYLYTIVDEITVEGCLTYNQTEVLKKADLFTGDNILSYDLNSISESIGMIPELTVLQIDRVFPNKIRIVVFERTAGAAIADIGGSYTIIDDDGYVLRIGVSEPDPGLPVVVGMFTTGFTINTKITQTGVDVRTTSLIELISALRASNIYERIISIDVSNPANVKLNASNGFTVMLGQAVDLKAKAERLAKALEIVERDYPMGGTIYIGNSDTIDFHPNLLPTEPSPGVNASTSPDASAMPETPEPSPGVNASTSPDASAMPETPAPPAATAAPDDTPAP